jgi:hypothetical protein
LGQKISFSGGNSQNGGHKQKLKGITNRFDRFSLKNFLFKKILKKNCEDSIFQNISFSLSEHSFFSEKFNRNIWVVKSGSGVEIFGTK